MELVLIALSGVLDEDELEILEISNFFGNIDYDFILENFSLDKGLIIANNLYKHRKELKENEIAKNLFIKFNIKYDEYIKKHNKEYKYE